MNKEIKNNYWLCNECAEKNGGKFPEDHVCTVIKGSCPICNTENITLIPWLDFDWPRVSTEHLRD